MASVIEAVVRQAGAVILGKERQIRLALACLLARGHLLLEDLPGMGKTTLAQALAKSLGLEFRRIQFTADLLPADIVGASIYERDTGAFKFHPGPIFSQVILADEVNRATPKTQSALLEAMEEHRVTVEGDTRALPRPFFVIATQNPSHQVGTFPLPESQLDRFLMRIHLGYQDPQAERGLLKGTERRELLAQLTPCMEAGELEALQHRVHRVHVSDALVDYLQAVIGFTRRSPFFHIGLSPRAGLALLAAARAWALMDGRREVLPEDVQAVLPSVVEHQLRPATGRPGVDGGADLSGRILAEVPIP